MPLVNRTFDQLINFTRTTAATFVGSNGLIQSTPQSRNLLTFTQEFDNAAWGKTAATVAANTATAPDGTNTADTILSTASAAGAPRLQLNTPTIAGQPYTLSAYFKANGTNFAFLSLRTAANDWAGAEFNLATGVVSRNASSGTVTYNGATITAVGDGWYRCAVTITPAAVSQFIFVGSSNGSGAFVGGYPNFTNAGTETVFIWGAQLEQASAATGYTRNFGGLFPPRFDYDPVTLAPRGLLIEEQRTNLLLRSEDFTTSWSTTGATITANATTSPDGATTADALVEDASTGLHLTQQFFTFLNATAYTLSIFVRPSTRTWVQVLLPASAFGASQGGFFDLTGAGALGNVTGTPTSRTITAVGGGWYRITVTATSTAAAGGNVAVVAASANGTTSYTGNSSTAFFLWGAQLEAGAFATSYIPTVASQVTRTADVAGIAAPNFASWYNQTEGTFVVNADTYHVASSKAFYAASDGSANNEHMGFVAADASVQLQTVVGGVTQCSLAVTTAVANTVFRAAYAYKVNDFAGSGNGGAVQTDTSGTLPTVDRLSIGLRGNGTIPLNGHIRSIRYYPSRLSNAQLQALTA